MGEAFTSLPKFANRVADHVTNAINHAVQAIADGSESAYNAALQELSEIQKETGKDVLEKAREEIKDQVLKRLHSLGVDDADKLAESKIKELWDKAEQLRSMPVKDAINVVKNSVKQGTKLGRWVLVSAVTASVALFVIKHPDPQDGLSGGAISPTYIPSAPAMPTPDPLMPGNDTGIPLVDNLGRGVEQTLSTPAAVSPEALAVLPPQVAAIAQQPITVTGDQNGVTKSRITSLGNFYYEVPAARHDIEEAATQAQQSSVHLDANPNNTLHSGQKNPPWAFPNHMNSLEGSWDGRQGGTDLHMEAH
jgi:hypothetical protein